MNGQRLSGGLAGEVLACVSEPQIFKKKKMKFKIYKNYQSYHYKI